MCKTNITEDVICGLEIKDGLSLVEIPIEILNEKCSIVGTIDVHDTREYGIIEHNSPDGIADLIGGSIEYEIDVELYDSFGEPMSHFLDKKKLHKHIQTN